MSLITIIGGSILAELLELLWQYAPTLKQSIDRVYRFYSKSIFLFLLIHTGYIYIIFISLRFDILNFPLILAITLKSIDIFTKLELIKSIYLKKELDEVMERLMNEKIPFWIYLISPLTYPYLIYWAIVW